MSEKKIKIRDLGYRDLKIDIWFLISFQILDVFRKKWNEYSTREFAGCGPVTNPAAARNLRREEVLLKLGLTRILKKIMVMNPLNKGLELTFCGRKEASLGNVMPQKILLGQTCPAYLFLPFLSLCLRILNF